jgi:hypothetical protein
LRQFQEYVHMNTFQPSQPLLFMLKTITQMQPLIYDVLLEQPRRRRIRRDRTLRLLRGIFLGLYVAAGLAVTENTGLAPWEGGFWLILVPPFALGEWTLRELSRWMQPRT